MNRHIWIPSIFIALSFQLFAQTSKTSKIEDFINEFADMQENLHSYLSPFASSFGANLNSGLYHTARIPQRGLHLYVGIETIAAFINEDQRTYTAVFDDPADIQPQKQETGMPTVFGSKKEKTVTFFGQDYNLPGGFDLHLLPVIAPRITIGSLMGTELSIRWVELDLTKDFGLLKITGFGIRHSISQYFPHSPIDMCFGFFVQDIKLGRIFKAEMGFFGAQASRKLGPLTIYGGLGIERATINLGNEEGVLQVQPITFITADRGRMNAGIALDLLLLKLHLDYTIGNQNIVVLGFGLGI